MMTGLAKDFMENMEVGVGVEVEVEGDILMEKIIQMKMDAIIFDFGLQ